MKKKVNIIYLLFILFIILFSYITKNSNIITLVISSSLGILLYNTLSKISINNVLEKYKNKYKIYKISIIATSIIFTIFAFLSFLLGNILSIEGLNIVNIVAVLFILTIILIKLTGVYLEKINYKKLGNKLLSIYELLIIIISSITSIIIYKVFNIKDYINIIILYSVNIIIFLIIMLLLYIFIFRKNKNKVKEKYNYKELIKNIFNIDNNIVIYSIIKESYIYTSIIVLYYILTSKYNYSYKSTSIIITNIYFYGITFIRYINYLLKKYLDFNYNDFNKHIVKIINYLLSICILLMIISGPICRLLFNTNNFLFDLIILLFFYTLYGYVIDTSIKVNNNKINKISLLSGLIIKLIFEIPLINANYRMGYNLSFGGILSIIIGMTISIIISIIFINKKLKINILDNFNNILNIIYQNIILCLILILFTLIVKVDTQGIISSILVIIFYIFITILFYIIRKLINKK